MLRMVSQFSTFNSLLETIIILSFYDGCEGSHLTFLTSAMSAGMKLIKMIPTSHTAEMRTKGRSSGGLMDASHTDITTINLRQIKM